MKILLDTHALLWIVTRDRRLSRTAQGLFLDTSNAILLSIASIWEIAIKKSLGRLTMSGTLAAFVNEHIIGNDIGLLNIQLEHIYQIETLPFHHRDPFDRLIVAQALIENIPVLSADASFDYYPVKRIWEKQI